MQTTSQTYSRCGTWNTRGLGAPTIEQALKLETIFGQIEQRQWQAALLTDTSWTQGEDVREREFTTKHRKWTILSTHKVSIALNEELAQIWRSGGREVEAMAKGRVLRTKVPAQQGVRGLDLGVVYAPTGKRKLEEKEIEREEIWAALTHIRQTVAWGMFLVIGGDFNAQVSFCKEGEVSEVVGKFGSDKQNEFGRILREWMEINEMVATNTYFHQNMYGTWQHPRFRTWHTIDYILVAQTSKQLVLRARTLHPPNNEPSQKWQAYTDHHPVEITLLLNSQLWNTTRRLTQGRVNKRVFRGNTPEAKRKRTEWVNKVEDALREQTDVDWGKLVATCTTTAAEVAGTTTRIDSIPWMLGRAEETAQHNQNILSLRLN